MTYTTYPPPYTHTHTLTIKSKTLLIQEQWEQDPCAPAVVHAPLPTEAIVAATSDKLCMWLLICMKMLTHTHTHTQAQVAHTEALNSTQTHQQQTGVDGRQRLVPCDVLHRLHGTH